MRQGNPLSPFLLCIDEETLNRHLSILVDQGKLTCISIGKTIIPSYIIIFVDDLLIFCKDTMKNA